MANITKFSKTIAGIMAWGRWKKQLWKDGMIRLIKHCFGLGITTFYPVDSYGCYTTESEFGKAFFMSAIPCDAIQPISKCGIQSKLEYRKSLQPFHQSNDQVPHSQECDC